MKILVLSTAFLFVTFLATAQTKTGTTVKTQTKVKTSAPVKPASQKAETEAERTARLQRIDTRARAMTATMAKHIELSLEQQVEVNQINRSSIEQVEAARIKYIRNLRKMNAEIQNIGTSRLTLLKDVLTPQQFQAYIKKREEKMGISEMDGKPQNPMQQNSDQ